MSEMNTSNSSNVLPQELQKFLKALKNNANWRDKLGDSLINLERSNVPKGPKLPENKIFKRHPRRISSEESLLTARNASDKSVAYIFKTGIGMSESHSDDNFYENGVPHLQCSENKDFHSLSLLKMLNEPEPITPKKHVKIKRTPRVKSLRKHVEDLPTFRGAFDKINHEQKLESLLSNIVSNTKKIRLTMDVGITPPDGDEEWERRYVRAKEFYSRFSRNYLYRLGRQVTDLENYYIKSSGRSSNRTAENIQQHLLGVYGTILNALQAYCSHMTTSLAYVAVDKLMHIYESICKCCVIMNKFINYSFEYRIEEVANMSKDMVDKLAQILFETPQLYCLTLTGAKSMRKGYKWEIKLPPKKPVRKIPLDARLSMYSISSNMRSKHPWKKTVEDLTKEKFRYSHVQSRYKTAIFKHRTPVAKPLVNEPVTKFKLLDKRSSSLLRNTPLLTPKKEDDIVTMVELVHKREQDSLKQQRSCKSPSKEKSGTSKQLDILTPIIQDLCHQICAQEGKNVTEDKLESILKNLLGMALDGKINKENSSSKNGIVRHTETTSIGESNEHQTKTVTSISFSTDKSPRLDKSEKDLHSYVDFIKNVRLELESNNPTERKTKMRSCTSVMETIENTVEYEGKICLDNQHRVTFRDDSKINTKREEKVKSGKRKKPLTVSVSGEKNAQLICIRDESSIIEVSEEETVTNKDKGSHLINANAKVACSKQHSNEVIKISRFPKKCLKMLELLSNSTMYDIIKYKISFKKYSRLNPMYRKSPTIQPWEIVESISETLLNELLLGIAKEMEENDILKNIYESEFC